MQSEYRSPKLQALCATGKLERFEKGNVIGSTDSTEGLTFITRGYVKRYRITERGTLGVQIIYGPQDIFPFTRIYPLLLGQSLHDGPEVYYYQAMCQVEICCLSARQLESAVEADPLLYKELFAEAGQHLKTCVHAIENKTFDSL